MGKSILTAKQLDFLELAQAQSSINKNFYLTGGTALSEFYFQHRLSEDIDLFSEKEVNIKAIEAFLQEISSKLGISKIIKQNYLGLYTYKLEYKQSLRSNDLKQSLRSNDLKQSLRSGDLKDGDILKVDFNYYPFPRIEKGVYFGKLEVSSIYDIAVNKIHTVAMRTRVRDYIDLYFIFKDTEYRSEKYLNRMRVDSQAKFDWPLEAKNLAAAFLKVKDLTKGDFPKMLVPFNKKDMEKFFLKLAKSLESDIFN